MALASHQVITGEPGSSWTNATDKIWYQARVNFRNSCAVCISVAGQIAKWWPFPFHFGCLCQNVPIAPGETAKPFIDFQERLVELGPAQQAAAVGASNWTLIQSGAVKWGDVVTRARVRDFREVVARQKLSVADLLKAGVSRTQALRAHQATHTADHTTANATRKAVAEALRQHGVTNAQIIERVGQRLAARVGVSGGPSGASRVSGGPRKPPGAGGAAAATTLYRPRSPISPIAARARLKEEFGEDVASRIDLSGVRTEADLERLILAYRQTPEAYRAGQAAYGDYLGFSTPQLTHHAPDPEK